MSARTFTMVRGADLKVGDVIAPWGTRGGDNRTSKVIGLRPYEGPLQSLWDRVGGAQLADLQPFGPPSKQFKAKGITIDPRATYYRLDNPQEHDA